MEIMIDVKALAQMPFRFPAYISIAESMLSSKINLVIRIISYPVDNIVMKTTAFVSEFDKS